VSRPRTMPADRVNTAIRFHPATFDRLKAAAAERGVSANFLVERAVADFLDRLLPVNEIKWTRPAPSLPVAADPKNEEPKP